MDLQLLGSRLQQASNFFLGVLDLQLKRQRRVAAMAAAQAAAPAWSFPQRKLGWSAPPVKVPVKVPVKMPVKVPVKVQMGGGGPEPAVKALTIIDRTEAAARVRVAETARACVIAETRAS